MPLFDLSAGNMGTSPMCSHGSSCTLLGNVTLSDFDVPRFIIFQQMDQSINVDCVNNEGWLSYNYDGR